MPSRRRPSASETAFTDVVLFAASAPATCALPAAALSAGDGVGLVHAAAAISGRKASDRQPEATRFCIMVSLPVLANDEHRTRIASESSDRSGSNLGWQLPIRISTYARSTVTLACVARTCTQAGRTPRR